MAATPKVMKTILVLIVTALFILSDQAQPSFGASVRNSAPKSLQLYDTLKKSPTMRQLTWFRWGRGDKEKTKTTTPALTTSPSLYLPIPITTEAPSRWKKWFSKAKDKLSNAAQKVKTELKEAKESYNRGMSFVGNAAIDGFQQAGSAISTGAKTLGNATLTAGRAIKEGANKFGSAVKSGFQKIRLKFSGPDEKFKIVANRLKEKLEAGDEGAKTLMEKLGINISYSGEKISGSHIANINISVTEVLRNEGLLSNKSASYHTAVEQPEIAASPNASENVSKMFLAEESSIYSADNDEFISAEDYLCSENGTDSNAAASSEYFNKTSNTHLPDISEDSSSTNSPIIEPNVTVSLHTQTTESSTTFTTPNTYTATIIKLFTNYTDVSSSIATTTSALLELDKTFPATSTLPTETNSMPNGVTNKSTTKNVMSLETTSSPVLSDSRKGTTIMSSDMLSSKSTGEPTDITKDKSLNSTTKSYIISSISKTTSLPTSPIATMPPLIFSTVSTSDITDTPVMNSQKTTIQTPVSIVSISDNTIDSSSSSTTPIATPFVTTIVTTTSSTNTNPPTTPVEITTSSTNTFPSTTVTQTTNVEILSTTTSTNTSPKIVTTSSSLLRDPTITLQSVTTSKDYPRIPADEDAVIIKPVLSEDGRTIVESELYEPPPFPDVFSDIAVHDRLRQFYDQGDFSHAEMTALFNFDPDNYEYYDY